MKELMFQKKKLSKIRKKSMALKKTLKMQLGQRQARLNNQPKKASKTQQSAQESIKKLTDKLKAKEDEFESLSLPEVTENEVLVMIEVAATSEELGEIEDSFEGDIPEEIQKSIEDRKQEMSANPKNLKQYPELRWKKASIEEVMKAQKECRLVGHDPKKGIALIKPKK